MEGKMMSNFIMAEISNLIRLSVSAFISLSFCYYISKVVPKGTTRLCTIFPVICLFLVIPLNLHSVHLIGSVSFFLSWLANFKLLLLAFGKGPLSTPSIPLSRFLAIACFPIKIPKNPPQNLENSKTPSQNSQNQESPPCPLPSKKSQKSILNYGVKGLLLALFLRVYLYREYLNPMVAWFFLGFSVYFSLELIVAISSALVGAFLGLELDPQFDEPFLATSLQDFWGRRWNVMATRILRPAVYDPIYSVSARVIGRMWAPLPAILSTFAVSGLMHELIFFYFHRDRPVWEITSFFCLHGVCLVMEVLIKKAINGKWSLPPPVAAPLIVGFVLTTSYWLFLPEMLRSKLDVGAFEDYAAVSALAKDVARALVHTQHTHPPAHS